VSKAFQVQVRSLRKENTKTRTKKRMDVKKREGTTEEGLGRREEGEDEGGSLGERLFCPRTSFTAPREKPREKGSEE